MTVEPRPYLRNGWLVCPDHFETYPFAVPLSEITGVAIGLDSEDEPDPAEDVVTKVFVNDDSYFIAPSEWHDEITELVVEGSPR